MQRLCNAVKTFLLSKRDVSKEVKAEVVKPVVTCENDMERKEKRRQQINKHRNEIPVKGKWKNLNGRNLKRNI